MPEHRQALSEGRQKDLFLRHGRRHDELAKWRQVDSWSINDSSVRQFFDPLVVASAVARVVR